MKLHNPFIITSRLLPGVRVGGATISIEYAQGRGDSGRRRFQFHIDLPGGVEHSGSDLQGHHGLQGAMEALLDFLGAAAESYTYRMRTGRDGENEDLFPPNVVEWAYQNSDEIAMLRCEIEETPNLIEE